MNAIVVLSPPVNTTTAVLVDSPLESDETTATKELCAEVATEELDNATVADALYVLVADALYVLGVGALVDDKSDVVAATEDGVVGDIDEVIEEAALDDDDAADEAVELEAAAQATFRSTCTPLLPQFESKVEAAAVYTLAINPCQVGAWLTYFLDRCSRSLKQGSSVSSPHRLVDKCRRCLCCCMRKVQLLKCIPPAMKLINDHPSAPLKSRLTEHDG